MKKFNHPDFRTRLGEILVELEQASQIEAVVLIRQRSANYEDVPLSLGIIIGLLTFTALLVIPSNFNDYMVYIITLLSFEVGILIGVVLPFMRRLLTTKKRQQRNVEVMARALFQKGGLHHTSTEVGTLIYFSLLEKMVFIVADRGAQIAIPDEEWQKLTTDLQSIFKSKNPAESLLTELEKCKAMFNRYIPALENKINELPNDLQIDL